MDSERQNLNSRWSELDKVDGLRDEPAADRDAIRAELDEIEFRIAEEWARKRAEELGKS